MAFSLTTDQIRKGTKTVTRRMGWQKLKPGQEFCAIVKGMGLKPGEKVVRLAILRCVSNRCEPLANMLTEKDAAAKEGFPDWSPHQFAAFFCKTHTGCTPHTKIQRIEFEYVRFLP